MQLVPSILLLLASIYLHYQASLDVLGNFFPRLKQGYQRRSLDKRSPVRRTAETLANSFGYLCEAHTVITDDGYILTVHRIRKFPPTSDKQHSVALLLPGFMASSDSWLFRGSNKDLPYIFADAGYDMWMYNPRGNVYSRNHVVLDPDVDEKFWNFSFHEMGVYDLPAVIDYILKFTKEQKVSITAHSMGAAISFVTCSLKPEYNKKISLIIALAPAAVINLESLNMATKTLIHMAPLLEKFLRHRRSFEIFPQRKLNGKLAELLCSDDSPSQELCLSSVFEVTGRDYEQFNSTMLPTAFHYYPSGTSLGTVMHMVEVFQGQFQYDSSGKSKEMDEYSHDTPYNLSKVTTPVAIFYGKKDQMVQKKDLERLAKQLDQVVGLYKVPHHSFNHLDFMWASDSALLLYTHLLNLMEMYK
ncbi:lipase 1-like [Agrilus planipennis]|uniref:Lipase n=1 Tax=Agrilus planipennis TaxID=224129 RepID=A0A1W4WI22_AGRPL|nr:lipase 1-like [Agrilus planipennis]